MSEPGSSRSRNDRVIDLSVEVPGNPQEVWQAVATGPGITSWFVPCEVAEQEGGVVTMSFGPMGDTTSKVIAWEPPHRVVFVDDGERPMAQEWLVEAKEGCSCAVRLVNSGFGEDEEWGNAYDAMSKGWKILLENLRLHLTHFRGQPARAIVPAGTAVGPNSAAFAAVCAALGVRDNLGAGERFVGQGDGIPALSGTVEVVCREPGTTYYLMLLEAPAPGHGFVAAEGDGDNVMVSSYLYLYGDSGTQLPDAWTPRFRERFPLAAS